MSPVATTRDMPFIYHLWWQTMLPSQLSHSSLLTRQLANAYLVFQSKLKEHHSLFLGFLKHTFFTDFLHVHGSVHKKMHTAGPWSLKPHTIHGEQTTLYCAKGARHLGVDQWENGAGCTELPPNPGSALSSATLGMSLLSLGLRSFLTDNVIIVITLHIFYTAPNL